MTNNEIFGLKNKLQSLEQKELVQEIFNNLQVVANIDSKVMTTSDKSIHESCITSTLNSLLATAKLNMLVYADEIKNNSSSFKSDVLKLSELVSSNACFGIYSANKIGQTEIANQILNQAKKIDINGKNTEMLESAFNKGNSNSSSSSCFICNAVYTSPLEFYIIERYREYRDNKLSNYFLGKLFIKWYYKNGPQMAKYISMNRFLLIITKSILNLINKLIKN